MAMGSDPAIKLRSLASRLMWISKNFSLLNEAYRAASSSLMKAASVPRSCDWRNDEVIAAIVESSDKQHCALQSMEALCQISAGEVKDAAESAMGVYEQHVAGEKSRAEKLQASFKVLKGMKKLHTRAIDSEKMDPWKTELDLKTALKAYLEADSEAERERRESLGSCEAVHSRLLSIYSHAFHSHIRSLRSHYSILCNTLPELPLGAHAEEEPKVREPHVEVDFQARFEEAYSQVLRSNYDDEVTRSLEHLQENIGIKGCGLFRHRKLLGSSAPFFFVLSNKNFLHCFLVNRLLSAFAENSAILKSLKSAMGAATAPFSFVLAEQSRYRELSVDEETELERLNIFLLEHIAEAKAVEGAFPIRLRNNKVKVDRSKLEIVIEERGRYFTQRQVRLKGFSLHQVQNFHALLEDRADQTATPSSTYEDPTEETFRVSWSSASFENPWIGSNPS